MIAGRYTLDREIGRGGMGSVWLGRDEVLGRAVAVKRLGHAPGESEPDLDRAEREARLAARLSHPGIVAVYDLVEEGEQRYLVMEHVEGTNLSGLLAARGPLPPMQAAALLGQAADALAAAHADGIVHRDVKPSNMLVDEEGHLKLSDFGIARAESDASLTQTGLVTGSPAYLAPEVASGGTATDRSDVWSLGASLFHALTGRPPYEVTDNVLGTLYRIVHEEPPRAEQAGHLAPVLEATMHRDPAQRWSMAKVRDVLLAGGSTAEATAAMTALVDEPSTRPLSSVPPVTTGRQPAAAAGAAAAAPADGAAGGTVRPGDAGDGRPRRRVGAVVAALLGVAVVALLVVAAYVLGQGRDADPDVPAAAPTDGPSSSSGPSGSPSEPSAPVTAAELEEFASSYVTTAAQDPAEGFRLLTDGYQADSDGLSGYRGFWGGVEEVTDFRPRGADPDAGTVSYTYTYRYRDGRTVTETVELTVEQQDDGRLLISGARTL